MIILKCSLNSFYPLKNNFFKHIICVVLKRARLNYWRRKWKFGANKKELEDNNGRKTKSKAYILDKKQNEKKKTPCPDRFKILAL